jgi:ABC-type glycerol-3-phosphate transport system substrate-binding protein
MYLLNGGINMKKLMQVFTLVMVSILLVSCGDGSGTGDISSGVRPEKEAVITFWGYGDDVEKAVFEDLVTKFNQQHDGYVEVKYVQKSADSYGEALRLGLQGSRGPDVVYVGDADFKALAELGYLLELDDYIEKSEEIKVDEMWPSSINRYLYDVNTTTQDGPDAHYWGIPKDIGPTVIYYNETFFKNAGVTVISVFEEDLEAFNNGSPDSRGKTKQEYGLTSTVKVKGYFEADGKKVFNNKIAMSWDETVALSLQVQNNSNAQYGFFTEWWFNYGWSVGGDCIQYIPSSDPQYNGGYWEFTLMDPTPNYMVDPKRTEGFTVNNTYYKPGEIISYYDKLASVSEKTIRPEILTAVSSKILQVLPSQREAFVEFVRIGQKSSILVDTVNNQNLFGYGITPTPTSIGGDSGKTKAFANGNVAMLIDGRWNVPNFRRQMDGVYEWDVAPLPIYRTYDANGDVLIQGLPAGHSGSVALAINKKTTKPNACWEFLEYIGGSIGQLEQAKSGFAIPSQIHLAETEDFLQSDQNPKNSVIFLDAAKNQTPGDWWYLRDKQWIDPWAGLLNGSVRNGKVTLSQFYDSNEYKTTFSVLKQYTQRK